MLSEQNLEQKYQYKTSVLHLEIIKKSKIRIAVLFLALLFTRCVLDIRATKHMLKTLLAPQFK